MCQVSKLKRSFVQTGQAIHFIFQTFIIPPHFLVRRHEEVTNRFCKLPIHGSHNDGL